MEEIIISAKRKEEMKMDNKELNMNEMEAVTGGERHFKPEKDRAGWLQHKVEGGETLIRIANRYRTTVNYLMDINPTITNKNDITAGYYMYVPRLLK